MALNYVDISDYQKTYYKEILKLIFGSSSVFKIIDPYGDLNVKNLTISEDLIDVKRSNSWEGTKSRGRKAYIYLFKITKKSREFFNKYDSFLKEDIDNVVCSTALGGQYDYSFIEKETEECILYITTHEGSVFLRKDITEHQEWSKQNENE